jgi:hypothetical protein
MHVQATFPYSRFSHAVRVGAARQKLPHTEKEELFPNWRSRQGSVRFGAVRF